MLKHLRYSVFLCAFGAVWLQSCRMRHLFTDAEDQGATKAEKSGNPIRKLASSFIAPPPNFFSVMDSSNRTLITIDDEVCHDDPIASGVVSAKIAVASDYGLEDLTLKIAQPPSNDIIAEISGTRMLVVSDQVATFRESLKSYCDSFAATKSHEVLARENLRTVLDAWLVAISPECHFREIKTDGWYCELPTGSVALATEELESIQKTMIERWNRQPYLFTRRLSVAMSLGKALAAENSNEALDRVCKVISFSLPQELPMVFNSRRWQSEICSQNAPRRIAVAVFGLFKAQEELEFLKLLFERTSSLGTLTVRLPKPNSTDVNTLWVSLRPAQEVTDNLAEESARIWNSGGDEKIPAVKPNSCWHPVFSDSSDLMQLAQYVGIAGNTTKAICLAFPPNQPSDRPVAPPRYIAESIASETEFVITNGHSKVLRLPQGTYQYAIAPAVNIGDAAPNIETMSHGEPTTGGTILWSKKAARPIIASW